MSNDSQNPATSFFSEIAVDFGDQYASKPCFRDRLDLFSQSLSRTTPLPAKVMDYGSGPGIMSLRFAEMGYDVTGFDGAEGMVELARRRASAAGLEKIQFNVMPATDVKFAPASFDAVVCSSVIEYVPDDMGLVSKLIGAVKIGGHLLLSVPHRPSLAGLAEDMSRARKKMFSSDGAKHLNLHLRRYSRNKLVADLSERGTELVSATTFELPVCGELGVKLSRISLFGVMLLVVGKRVR